jgi:hypothetical protein
MAIVKFQDQNMHNNTANSQAKMPDCVLNNVTL